MDIENLYTKIDFNLDFNYGLWTTFETGPFDYTLLRFEYPTSQIF